MKSDKYIAPFDGLRLIALLAVVFYHLFPRLFKAGYLGVLIFFIMAGYLTVNKAISLGESESRPKLVLSSIWDKFLKLYPPLLIMLISVSLFVLIFFKPDLGSLGRDIRSSLLSFNNYSQLLAGQSYFDTSGRLNPFTHLWALSLEFQVYIFIFILIYGNYKEEKRGKYIGLFFILSLLSYLFSIYLLNSNSDFSEFYYRSGSRLYHFSLGAIGALLSKRKLDFIKLEVREFLIFILLSLSILSFFVFNTNFFTFKLIFPLYSLVIATLMILLRESQGFWARLLSSRPLSFLAKRSYHIYLWHLAILSLEEKYMANKLISNMAFYLIFFLICLFISEFSYRLDRSFARLKSKRLKSSLILALVLIMVFFPYEKISNASKGREELEEMRLSILENEKIQRERLENNPNDLDEKEEENQEEEEKEEEKKIDSPSPYEEKDFSQSYYKALDAIDWVNQLDNSLYLDPEVYTNYRQVKGLLLGDSLASMAYHTLYTYMPGLVYDSSHSRQMKDAYDSYIDYKDEELGAYLILSLGTNGDVLHEDIDRIRELAGDKKIILLTIVLPYKNQEEERNKSIRSYAEKYDNVYLVDWYSASKDKPELFFDDKIHTGERGARVLGQIIISKIIEIEHSLK